MIYAACSHKTLKHKMKWAPYVAVFTEEEGPHFKESDGLYIIDPKTDQYKELTIRGLGSDSPLYLFKAHGISLYSSPEDNDVVWIHAVNHMPKRMENSKTFLHVSCVSIFKHRVNETFVEHVETIYDNLITTPNDILALSEKSFYVTNDHRYNGYGIFSFLMRQIEDISFLPWGNIVFREHSGKIRVVVREVSTPNGLCKGPDGMIVVDSSSSGVINFFQARTDGALSKRDTVQLPHVIDNPSYDPDTKSLYVTAHVNVPKFFEASKDVSKKAPSAVYRIFENNSEGRYFGDRFIFEKLLENDGKLVSSATTAIRVQEQKKLYVTGIYGSRIAVLKDI